MTSGQIRVCSLLIKEHFGEVVEKVCSYLLKKGETPLGIISRETGLKTNEVRKALTILITHSLVVHDKHKKGFLEYSAISANVLTLLRFPRFIYCIKTLYGDEAELLIEELLHSGRAEMSDIIQRVTDRLNEGVEEGQKVTIHQLRDKFVNLAQTHFIFRCQDPSEKPAEDDDEPSTSMYTVPSMENVRKRKRSTNDDYDGQPRKRIKSEPEESYSDKGIYWQVDYNRFNYYLRDQTIVEAVTRKLDHRAGTVVRTLLRLSEVKTATEAINTTPLSYNETFQGLPCDAGMDKQLLDQYLKILFDDSTQFLYKAGDSGGGMYTLNFKKLFAALCTAHIESVVQERFGSKCLRIFRILLLKKQLEQKQIEEYAMITAKETKELLYRMYGEHFIALTEVPKTPDHAPSRTFYLFSININKVARMLLDRCYKAYANLFCRRDLEVKEHKRLLEKQHRLEAILATLEQTGADQSQKAEIEEMITPTERAQLSKIKHMTNKLEKSELQMDETVFVLEMYLKYAQL